MMEIPYYEDKIIKYPLLLLERIRLLIHTPMRATYPRLSLPDPMSRLVNLRQKYNEDLLDYLERFMEERNISNIRKHTLNQKVKLVKMHMVLE